MSAKHLIWAIAALVVVGAVGFLAVVLGGVAPSRPSSTTAAGALASAPATAPAASHVASAAGAGSAASLGVASPPSQATSSKTVSASSPKQVSNHSASVKPPVKPKPSGPTLKDHVTSQSAVTFLSAKEFGAPETYSATIVPVGWSDKASGSLVARVVSASLAGAINASTGQQMAPPAAGAVDRSKQLEGVTIVSATNPVVRGDITNQQAYKVYIVLQPSGAGAVFVVDRLR